MAEYKTQAGKSLLEKATTSVKELVVPDPKRQLLTKLTAELVTEKYDGLASDQSSDIVRYTIYQDYFDGKQWRNIYRDPSRSKIVRNLCASVVRVKGGLLGKPPIVTVPRESERSITADVEKTGEEIDLGKELNMVDVRQKIIRNALREAKYDKVFKDASVSASKFGVRYIYWYFDKEKKRPCAEELFPGFVRVRYKSLSYNEIQYAFVGTPMDVDEIERQYKVRALADKDMDLEYFRAANTEYSYMDESKNQALVTNYWGPAKCLDNKFIHARIVNREVVWYEEWSDGCPIFAYRKSPQPARKQGISDLAGIVNTTNDGTLSMQDNYNAVNSDELDIIGLYSFPRVVIMTDGQIDVGVMQSTKARIIKLPKDASARILEFTGKVYELKQHKADLLDDIVRSTSVPKSAFGVPDTSILTGAGINAEWQPLINECVEEFTSNLAPVLVDEFQYVSGLLRKYGGSEPETKKKYSDLLPEKFEVRVESGIKVPRDEQGWINMVTMMKREGLISISTGIRLLNYVESSDDEMKTITRERLDPRFNPELALKIKQLELKQGVVDEEQVAEHAYDENNMMARGIPAGVSETKPEEHRIHLLTHKDFRESSSWGGLVEDDRELFNEHIRLHEDALGRGGKNESMIPKTEEMDMSLGGNPAMTMFPRPELTPTPPASTGANQPGQQPAAPQPSNAPVEEAEAAMMAANE
jgi:hypothetical protein